MKLGKQKEIKKRRKNQVNQTKSPKPRLIF